MWALESNAVCANIKSLGEQMCPNKDEPREVHALHESDDSGDTHLREAIVASLLGKVKSHAKLRKKRGLGDEPDSSAVSTGKKKKKASAKAKRDNRKGKKSSASSSSDSFQIEESQESEEG